jgi:hypothetical protein
MRWHKAVLGEDDAGSSDTLTLEEAYRLLAEPEDALGRKINPTLYTTNELDRRLGDGNAFLRRVLAGKKIVLIGEPPEA